MKILVNASRDIVHPHAGGSEVYVDHVLKGLHERGHEVHLSAGRPVGTHRYGASDSGGTFSQYLTAPLRAFGRQRGFDVVVDVANGMTYYSPLYRACPTVCLVHHVHTSMWSQWFSPPVAAFGRFLEKRMMPLVYRRSLFVTVSESSRRALNVIGVPDSQIRIAPNATLVPVEPCAETDPSPLFVAVGRLVPHKRFELLLERWPEIRRRTGGRLVIVGEGPERSRLEALLSDGATLAGSVSNDERDRYLAKASLLVHPASVEGWGLVVMEAAAQGTPALGFDVPGVRDSIVDGSTGWLAADNDLDAFVEAWVHAANDTPERLLRAEASRARAHQFGVERTVTAFEAALLEAVADRSLAPAPAQTARA